MVVFVVHRRGKARADDADAPAGVFESEVFRAAAGGLRPHGGTHVEFGRWSDQVEAGDAGREHERPVGTGERLGDRADRRPFGAAGLGWVGPVVLVREMDDRVRGRRAGANRGEVVEITAVDGGAEPFHDGGRILRPGQAGDLVAGVDQLGHDRAADEPGGAGDEDAHFRSPS